MSDLIEGIVLLVDFESKVNAYSGDANLFWCKVGGSSPRIGFDRSIIPTLVCKCFYYDDFGLEQVEKWKKTISVW
jgi:hypothetical protein